VEKIGTTKIQTADPGTRNQKRYVYISFRGGTQFNGVVRGGSYARTRRRRAGLCCLEQRKKPVVKVFESLGGERWRACLNTTGTGGTSTGNPEQSTKDDVATSRAHALIPLWVRKLRSRRIDDSCTKFPTPGRKNQPTIRKPRQGLQRGLKNEHGGDNHQYRSGIR